MKTYVIILLGLFLSCGSINKHHFKKKATISGTVTYRPAYCGGAMLPDEEYKERTQERPLSGFKIYIKEGTKNDLKKPIIDSTITNENGEFGLQLPEGEYILLSSYQLDKDVFERYKTNEHYILDTNCLSEWWDKGLANVRITGKTKVSFDFFFRKTCFIPLGVPCIIYKGPYPP